jgi:hypothetical protein
LILPGESPDELRERYALWEADLGAATEPERYEVMNAVHASWRHDRMRRVEAVAVNELVARVTERYHDEKEAETRQLAEQLEESPAEVVAALRDSTAGLWWMIGQLKLLAEWLTVSYGFQRTHRIRAISLCGKRPVDLFDDPAVWHWDWLNLGAGDRGDLSPRDWAMMVLASEKPPQMAMVDFEVRLEVLTRHLPTEVEAQAGLQKKVAAMLAELTERRALIALREKDDVARAIEKAKLDMGPDAAKRQRVEHSMDRLRRGSLKELRALQKSRPEQGDNDGTPGAPEPERRTEPDGGSIAPEPARNHDRPHGSDHVVMTVTNGSIVTTGSTGAVETPGHTLFLASADAAAGSGTPQKRRSEPICQNGSHGAEAEERGSEGLCAPEETGKGGSTDLIRPSPTQPGLAGPVAPGLSQEERDKQEKWERERKELRERGEREHRERMEALARRADAFFGIDCPGADGDSGRPPPESTAG